MRFFINSLNKKIILILISLFVLFFIGFISIIYLESKNLSQSNLIEAKQYMLHEKHYLIKNELATAKSTIYTILQNYKNVSEAKEEIIKVLNGMRFAQDSAYFYAYEEREDGYYHGMNGEKQNLIGTKVEIDNPDIKGFPFRRDIIKYANKDKFTVYYSKKPTTKKIIQKMAYGVYIPELKWVLATGIYLDDVDIQLKQMEENYDKRFIDMFWTLFLTFVGSLFLLILISIVMLNIILIKPIKRFQDGLLGFFRYLNKESQTADFINIQTHDEIGSMANEVNKGISASIKLHGEIFNLMNVMDKNVITSETDDKGIITYVSEAFCKISGYEKDELIGKSHNIIRHPDMSKEIFENLWTTILKGETWQGEIKNRKKDGGIYWVRTIITPKCTKIGANCGYTAIREDITAQKEVEELKNNLELRIEERTIELENEKKFINSVMNSQNSIVIATNGVSLKTANKSFFVFFNVKTIEEFVLKYGECICDTFDRDASGKYIQKTMDNEKWIDYAYARPNQLHKIKITIEGEEHIFSITSDSFEFNGEILQTAVLSDITELENINIEIIEAKNLIEKQILFEQAIIDAIPYPLFYKGPDFRMMGVNKAYEESFGTTRENLIGKHILELEYLSMEDRIMYHAEDEQLVNTASSMQKEIPTKFADGKMHHTLYWKQGFLDNEGKPLGLIGTFVDLSELHEAKEIAIKAQKETAILHKQVRDSIEYASLIQHSLIPSNDLFRNYFSDYFTIWHPKDIVGGDIYFFEELRSDDECLLMVIDCTGHGVPGAFVSMLVKAIERQIVSNILYNLDEIVSPAKLLAIFNRSMKHLLKQEDDRAISNAGFDGGILYYNKKENSIKYAGANTALFILNHNELEIIKGDKHSIGYKKSDGNFHFSEHTINTKNGMSFYITTDGYLDQNGGEKGFPFSRKRFENLLKESQNESMADIQEILMDSLASYQKDEDRNDDVTIIGIKI